MKEKCTHNQVEEILQSLDGMNRAEANPFLYTRIQARLDMGSSEKNAWGWIRKPVFSFATLSLLIILNVAAISTYLKKGTATTTQPESIENFAQEYHLDGSSAYNDKTQR